MGQSLARLKSIAVPAAFGLAFGVCTFAVHVFLASFEYDSGLARGNVELVWLLGGSVILGAAPAVAWMRYRLRSPLLVALGGYLFLLVTSWPGMVGSARNAGVSVTMTMFELVLSLWVLLLAVALYFGFVEYLLRPTIRKFISVSNG